jgi:hypothetical protein
MGNKMNIYQRVNCVMKEVTYVQKESKKVNGQYTFVSHDAVTGRLHEPMAKHGIVMIPSIVELTQDGNRTAVKMEIHFVNIDEPNDKITVIQYGYGIDPQDKGIGKAQSYAVKYALLKLFCLETGDDVEKDNIDYKPEESSVAPEILRKSLQERKKEIMALIDPDNIEQMQIYVKKLKETYKSKKEEDLFLATDSQTFVENFFNWKDQSKAA